MLTQPQADDLIAMEKVITPSFTSPFIALPAPGDSVTYPLVEKDGREPFQLDVNRGFRIDKWTFQLRNRNITILVRLDIGGYPHPNPDRAPTGELHPFEGRRIECPHLQRYVVGFEDRWPSPPLVIWFRMIWTKLGINFSIIVESQRCHHCKGFYGKFLRLPPTYSCLR